MSRPLKRKKEKAKVDINESYIVDSFDKTLEETRSIDQRIRRLEETDNSKVFGADGVKYPDFSYIEAAIGGLQKRNLIVKINEMPALSGREDYHSMFRFNTEFLAYYESEITSKDKVIKPKNNVSGYNGICYTDYLWIDVDRANNLPKAFEDITYLINRLQSNYDVDPNTLRVYFTGSKGFCVGIPSELFSFEPSEHLPKICKKLALKLAGDIGIDESIYETIKLWRFSNTINAKSGLYKIELDPGADILLGDLDDILEMAKTKRTDKVEHPDLDESHNGMLVHLVKDIEIKNPEGQKEPKHSVEHWIVDALDGVNEGERNNTLFRLAGYLLSKHPQDIAYKILSNVNDRCTPPVDDKELQTLFNSSLKSKENPEELSAQDSEVQGSKSIMDLRQNPPKRKPCLVGDGVLPAFGYTILGGQTKEGKSTLVMQLCFCILSGTPFLNRFPIEAKDTHILYINLELDEGNICDMVDSQIENFDIDLSDKLSNFNVWTLKGFCLSDKKDVDMLKAEILAKHIELVVVDPVSLAMRHDQNEYRVVRAFVQQLDKISLDVGGVAWLLIHHFTKPNDAHKETIHRLIGSSAWGNFAETVIGIERYSPTRSADYKSLNFKLRGGRTPDDITLYHNPETRLFDVVQDVDDMPAIKLERIVGIFQNREPQKYGNLVKLIQEELRLSDRQAKYMIAKAIDRKLIIKKEKLYMVESCTKLV